MRIESLHDLHAQFPDIDGFWDFESLERTEANLLKALPEGLENLNLTQLEILTQLGRVYALKGDFPAARAQLLKVAKQLPNLSDLDRERIEIRHTLEGGRVFSLSMSPIKAQDFFSKTWTATKSVSKYIYFAIDSAVMMAISQPVKRRHEWLELALSLAEKTEQREAQKWLVQLYTMAAWSSFDLRRFDEALKYFEKALARPRFENDEAQLRTLRWSIARTKRELGRVAEAMAEQEQLLKEQEMAGKISGHVFLEIAECLQALEKHPEAKTFFESAHKELSTDTWYADNKPEELARILYLWKRRT